jgi:hypothetical protein
MAVQLRLKPLVGHGHRAMLALLRRFHHSGVVEQESGEVPLVKVAFRDKEGEVETLWAFHLGGKRYQLENTPWYQYGVSWKDVIEAEPEEDDGLPFFKRVLTKSGYRTVRVASDEPVPEEFLERIKALNCSFEGATRKYLAIDIPPSVDLAIVVEFLTTEGVRWEYADPTYEQVHGNEDLSRPPAGERHG